MYGHLEIRQLGMASNIIKITFIIGNHTPHKTDFNCNKYIK
jgi:hypothetical protein